MHSVAELYLTEDCVQQYGKGSDARIMIGDGAAAPQQPSTEM